MENRTLAVASLIAAIASLAVSTMTLVVVLRQPAFPREFVVKPQESWIPKDAPILQVGEEELRNQGWILNEADRKKWEDKQKAKKK